MTYANTSTLFPYYWEGYEIGYGEAFNRAPVEDSEDHARRLERQSAWTPKQLDAFN